MEQIRVKQREVVLVPFPFSNQRSLKTRPALVISHDYYNQKYQDVVVCAITSNLERSECSFPITQDDFSSGNLPLDSMVRMNVITTIDKSLIRKSLGVLRHEHQQAIERSIHKLIAG